jgi:septum site-determining protein MinC
MSYDSALPETKPNDNEENAESNSALTNHIEVIQESLLGTGELLKSEISDSSQQEQASVVSEDDKEKEKSSQEVKDDNELDVSEIKLNPNIQVKITTEEGRLLLILPTESQIPSTEANWYEIWQQMRLRLLAGDRFWQANSIVHLHAGDRLLDGRQMQEISEALTEAQLQLKSVATSRRQTAITAVTAGYSVEQISKEKSLFTPINPPKPLEDALYLELTIRSGIEIRHPGTVIIFGDVNPGGTVIADGDILIWGRLRGIAHAGAGGNQRCLIMALQMEPTQLRIADSVARAPEKSPSQLYPEVASITPQGIRIAKAVDFARPKI